MPSLSCPWVIALCLCLVSVYTEEILNVNYRGIPSVIPLSNDTFESNIGNGRWFVIFYRSSCGGCKRYFSTFTEIVKDIKSWPSFNSSDPPFRMASVDCESPEGSPVCMRFKIDSVPNLRFFSGNPEIRAKNPGGIYITPEKDISTVRRELVTYLLKETKLVDHSETEQSDRIIVESNSHLENTLIILEAHRKLNKPMTSRVNPSMTWVVVRAPNGAVIVSGTPEHVQRTLRGNDKQTASTEMTTPSLNRESLYAIETPVYAVDVFRGLSAVFESDMPMFPIIKGEERTALLEFLGVLEQLLPASESYRRNLTKLHNWVSQRESFSGEDWLHALGEMKFPLSRDDYKGCKGSSVYYRGYSCSLWTIFHALTVSQCEREDVNKKLKPTAVVHAMNRFIPRFFSCLECAYHFALNSRILVEEHETAIPTNRIYPNTSEFLNYKPLESLPPIPQNCDEQILWLNTAHNGVNMRLAGQNTEDPTAPKVLYPPRTICPKCWSPVAGEKDKWVLGETTETKAALLQFLKNHYSSSNWVMDDVAVDFITVENVTRVEADHPDLWVIAIVAGVLTIVALAALIFVSRALWRCRIRRSFYTPAHNV